MADAEPPISVQKLKAAVTLGLTLEQAVKTGAVPLPPDKLKALQTLGLTLAQAVEKGIIKPTAPAAAKAPTADAKAPAPKARAPAAAGAEAEAVASGGGAGATEAAAKRKREEEEQERRKAAAARFAAARSGAKPDTKGSARAGEGAGPDIMAVPGGCSDETLVDAVGAVVTFTDSAGAARVLAPQASEVAYLVSDAVFWTLLRRLAAEILALEASEDLDGFWESSPSGSEGALQFADARGYLLPKDLPAPAADGAWRRALLAEAAVDLMAARLAARRGFDLPALAGPAEAGKGWVERPADNLQGVASGVDSSASAGLAEELVRELGSASYGAAGNGAAAASFDQPLLERLAAVADAVGARAAGQGPTVAPDSGHAPALHGGWTLLQEMGIREAAQSLQSEYTVRRRILLRRLDCTVQVMCSCERAAVAAVQRKTADILSRMWAGWRRDAGEAPPLSEWSALAVTRGVLARAVAARVSGPGARVSSKVKKVSIGAVPNRGGKPEGYTKTDPGTQAAAPAQEKAASSAVTVTMPKAQRGPRQRTFAASSSSGAATGSGAAVGSGSAASSSAPAATASSGAAVGSAVGAAVGGGGAAAASEVGAAPAAGGGAATGAAFVAAREEKPPPTGARSTNKEAHKEYRQQKRKEWEGKVSNNYYEELAKRR